MPDLTTLQRNETEEIEHLRRSIEEEKAAIEEVEREIRERKSKLDKMFNAYEVMVIARTAKKMAKECAEWEAALNKKPWRAAK
jgi:predicted RNase H-like nuclease (RuvC/YqgF family)